MRKLFIIIYTAVLLIALSAPAFAMHIMEGFLPVGWAAFWWAIILPVIYLGLRRISAVASENPQYKILLALSGAFVFVLSALKIPSVTGSCSHPTGVGLGAIIFGPSIMAVLSVIVLFFQALLLAHGGISTLGANTFSMGIAGPVAAYISFKLGQKIGISRGVNTFFAAFWGDIITYIMTSIQLAIAFSTPATFAANLIKFVSIFAVTQLPLAAAEGILTVLIFNFLETYNKEELLSLQVLTTGREAK